MLNSAFAAALSEMAVLLELDNANVFRVRAYQRAAQTIEGLSRDIGKIPPEELLESPGIGKGIAEKIQEFIRTGRIQEHQDLRHKFPAGLLNILGVPGLGPKRARLLFEALHVDSPRRLKEAAVAGRLRKLPGFGPKLEAQILKGLHFAEENVQKV